MPRQPTILVVFFLLTIQPSSTQTYIIQSFDGIPTKIRLCSKPECNTLRVTTDKDTLYFDDWWATDSVRLLGKNFLQVYYAVRGGSNQGLTNYLLLSVKNHKLIESILINSFTEWWSLEHMTYQAQPTLLGNDPGTYRLALDIRSADSTRAGFWTFSRHDRDTLSFDPHDLIFYNKRSPTPSISLGRTYFTDNLNFLYIGNLWSEDNGDGNRDSPSRRP